MAPLLRHPAGDSPDAAPSSNMAAPRRFTLCTLVSHEGPAGDQSFLVLRERPGPMPSGDRIVLRGSFGVSVRERLASLLAALPVTDKPLHVDLRRVTALDQGCLSLLLKTRRDHSPRRHVVFQVADVGPVSLIARRLGLEKKIGKEESLVSKAGPAPAVILPWPRLKTPVPTALPVSAAGAAARTRG